MAKPWKRAPLVSLSVLVKPMPMDTYTAAEAALFKGPTVYKDVIRESICATEGVLSFEIESYSRPYHCFAPGSWHNFTATNQAPKDGDDRP